VTNRRIVYILLTVIFLLLIPLIAMQFTEEVNWNIADFIVAGILLTGAGLLCEFTIRKTKKSKLGLIICCIIVIIFVLIWAELAVGIFNTPFAGN